MCNFHSYSIAGKNILTTQQKRFKMRRNWIFGLLAFHIEKIFLFKGSASPSLFLILAARSLLLITCDFASFPSLFVNLPSVVRLSLPHHSPRPSQEAYECLALRLPLEIPLGLFPFLLLHFWFVIILPWRPHCLESDALSRSSLSTCLHASSSSLKFISFRSVVRNCSVYQ